MQKTFFVNLLAFSVAAGTAIVTILIACCLIYTQRLGSSLVFLGLSFLFLKESIILGAKVTINPQGVSCVSFGRLIHSMTWNEIREIGIASSRVFCKGEKTHLYIYFSKTSMTDQQHFQMMLKWPPKNCIFLEYDKTKLDFIQSLYGKKIQKHGKRLP